jgi:hypothetical protein
LSLAFSLEFCPLTSVAFSSSFFPVFLHSGFKRTLCGGQWSRALTSSSGTSGRYGCCDAGTYMANPELNPFVKTNACQDCSSSAYNPIENAKLTCALPTCAVTDGSAANVNPCACGTIDCFTSNGLFCLESQSKCGKVTGCPGFYPADSAALKTAVQSCLSETGDGSCPTFAASNDATGNPYGVMGDWDVSKVTSLLQSTFIPPSCFCRCFFHLNSVHSLPLLLFFTFSRFYL